MSNPFDNDPEFRALYVAALEETLTWFRGYHAGAGDNELSISGRSIGMLRSLHAHLACWADPEPSVPEEDDKPETFTSPGDLFHTMPPIQEASFSPTTRCLTHGIVTAYGTPCPRCEYEAREELGA